MKESKTLNFARIVPIIGFISCVIGWLGFFYVSPLTLLCGIILIRNRKFISGLTCLIIGLLQLFLLIRPPISW